LTQDKIKSHLRINEKNNKIEVKFSEDLIREDVFFILKKLFPEKINDCVLSVLNRIYDKTSFSIHRGITTPNYLIWTSWDFIVNQLTPEFDNMDTAVNERLDELISKFKDDEKSIITHRNI
jgi:hypothetical protein